MQITHIPSNCMHPDCKRRVIASVVTGEERVYGLCSRHAKGLIKRSIKSDVLLTIRLWQRAEPRKGEE
jgi:hypothetical protein